MNEFSKSRKVSLLAEVKNMADAFIFLKAPGDAVIVNRGCLRAIVFSCPDGCGETLTVNLDARSGKAWRLYKTNNQISLYPSVWRDNGCKSHFIILRNQIIWFGKLENNNSSELFTLNPKLDDLVLKALIKDKFLPYWEIAYSLNEIPWDVLQSCIRLTKLNKACRDKAGEDDFFKLL